MTQSAIVNGGSIVAEGGEKRGRFGSGTRPSSTQATFAFSLTRKYRARAIARHCTNRTPEQVIF